MKFAIISDTHFGDPACMLVSRNPNAKGFTLGPKYNDFSQAVGNDNDYLILLGDIFDFSIATYNEAYDASRAFFQQMASDHIAREIIYVPGNHDFSAWHIFLHEINVINRIKDFRPLAEQRWSCPAVLKDGPNPDDWFTLPYVTLRSQTRPKYGGIFLEYLTRSPGNNRSIPFNVAYPNIYFITDRGEGILLTHGHYFEPFWAFAGEFAKEVVRDDLKTRHGKDLDIDEYVSVNFPLNELASSGLGQAAPITKIVYAIQREVKDHQLNLVSKYLTNLKSYINACLDFRWYQFLKKKIMDMVMCEVESRILNALKEFSSSRYDADFMNNPDTQQRFQRFHVASTLEVDLLNHLERYQFNIPALTKVIFGHTHEPILLNAPKPTTFAITSSNKVGTLFNTGGWLLRPGGQQQAPVGAAVFKYESGAGFHSIML